MARYRNELDREDRFAIAIDPVEARPIGAESGADEEHGPVPSAHISD